jgi:hypothetical protein
MPPPAAPPSPGDLGAPLKAAAEIELNEEAVMSATETTRSTLGRSKLTFSSEADIGEFVTTLARYEKGELTADQWRAFRLVRGTYGQRQDDVSMLRVGRPTTAHNYRLRLAAPANLQQPRTW